jgi:hypothetical protein
VRAVPTTSLSEIATRLANLISPILGQQSLRDVTMKAAVRPIAHLRYMSMLHRIEVDVVDVALQVGIISNGMFPIATLPNSPLTVADLAGASRPIPSKSA